MDLKTTNQYLEAICQALSDKNKIKFIAGKHWAVNVKDKSFEFNIEDLKKLPALVTKGLILHETGHIKHTTDYIPNEISEKYPALHEIYNACEDIRIEKLLIDEYGEYASQALLAKTNYYTKYYMENLNKFKQYSKLNQLMLAIILMQCSTSHNTKYLIESFYILHKELPIEVIKVLNVINTNNIVRLNSTQAVKNYVDANIYPRIRDWLEQEPDQKMLKFENPKAHKSPVGTGLNIADIPSDPELKILLSPYITTLSTRIQDILKEKLASKYSGNYNRGKLINRNVYKVLTEEKRIFSRKNNPDKPNYVVSMLLDESGSMAGQKHAYTYMAGFILQELCYKLKFKLNVIRYDDYTTQSDNIRRYRTDYRGGGNREDIAISCLKHTTNRNDDNLVFILTDGCGENIKSEIEQLTRDNYLISAIGIGLSNSELINLKQNYKNNINCENVSELPQLLINHLQQLIHR